MSHPFAFHFYLRSSCLVLSIILLSVLFKSFDDFFDGRTSTLSVLHGGITGWMAQPCGAKIKDSITGSGQIEDHCNKCSLWSSYLTKKINFFKSMCDCEMSCEGIMLRTHRYKKQPKLLDRHGGKMLFFTWISLVTLGSSIDHYNNCCCCG